MKHADFTRHVDGDLGHLGRQRRAVSALPNLVYRTVGKRLFDVVFALLLLPVLLPIIAVFWLMARKDGGAGFFCHDRIGQNGVMFRCWKIRTMVPDAELKLHDCLDMDPDAKAEWSRDQKLQDDPRVTRFGAFLRPTSLDELPQIWNVLTGDMSFVGPRPIVLDELSRYGRHQEKYLAMKPGITGIWQTAGRNDVTYDERVAMDVTYLSKISFVTDVSVLLKTVRSVLDRTGN